MMAFLILATGISLKEKNYKSLDNPLLGIHVLSMSKRIMNEVMCLAFDIGCHIYYQDTDSMHIEKNDLNMLATEFKKKYDRELIGTDLGQFHSDFPLNGHNDMPVAIIHECPIMKN